MVRFGNELQLIERVSAGELVQAICHNLLASYDRSRPSYYLRRKELQGL
jgi:hypothetical protein